MSLAVLDNYPPLPGAITQAGSWTRYVNGGATQGWTRTLHPPRLLVPEGGELRDRLRDGLVETPLVVDGVAALHEQFRPERQVVADEDPRARTEAKRGALVNRVADAHGQADLAAGNRGGKVQDAEEACPSGLPRCWSGGHVVGRTDTTCPPWTATSSPRRYAANCAAVAPPATSASYSPGSRLAG